MELVQKLMKKTSKYLIYSLYVYMMFDVNIIVMQFVDISWVAMKDKS